MKNLRRYELLVYLVIVANILGTVTGYYYYKEQLLASPLRFWIFISDCPNYTLLFALSLSLLLLNKKHNLFNFIVAIGTAKYGFWTMFAILFYSGHFLSPEYRLLYILLFFLHFGMMVEPVLILHKIEARGSYVIIALFWFLLNDSFDYILATHPWLPNSLAKLNIVAAVTTISTIVFTYIIYYLCRRRESILKGLLPI